MSVTRLNPTVNGYAHLGHMYLALVNEHAAHSTGGRFIVRFDDAQHRWLKDLGASRMRDFAAGWVEDLEWLGIKVDEWVYESDYHQSYDELIRDFYPGLCDPDEPLNSPQFIGRAETPYPYVAFITASIALMDAAWGVDTVIAGEELATRFGLYCWFAERFGLKQVKHVFLPRLRGAGELDNVSKTAGTYKVRTYRERGYSPGMVREMLAYACLIDPSGPWALDNIKAHPQLIASDQTEAFYINPRASWHASAVGEAMSDYRADYERDLQ